MNAARHNAKSRSRAGLTLVIVLGFLAVLAVLAVSLTITMRIERLATASFADVTRARQLIHAALARALDDVDADMAGRLALYPRDAPYAVVTNTGAVGTNFLANAADLFIPGAEYPNPMTNSIRLNDVTNTDGRVIGRVGYYAINCSGLLDANIIGGVPRGQGRGGNEIPISPSLLAEINNATEFLRRRTNFWKRVESLPELYYLGSQGNPVALVANTPPEHLFVYSNFGADLRPNGEPKISLAGTADELAAPARRTNIVAGLTASGVPNADQVFDNLLDYVDTDSEPRDLNSFCTEAVPMINEIIFSNVVTRQVIGLVTNYTHRFYMTVETWFPFGDRGFANAQISPETTPAITFLNQVPAPLALDAVAHFVGSSSPPIAPDHTANSFRQTTFVWEKTTNGTMGSALAGVQFQLTSPLRVTLSGTVLDRAVAPPSNTRTVRAPIPPDTSASRISSLMVEDPRLNHEIARWTGQMEQPPTYLNVTPARTNAGIAAIGERPSMMHVRDFPLHQPKVGVGLGSVTDLGFLSVGLPWRTIALYNAPGTNLNPVLDHFAISTNSARRALVNVNTPHGPVLASAFYELPVESYPGGGGPAFTLAASRLMATNLLTRLAQSARYETNRSIAVLGEFDAGLVGLLNGALTSPLLADDATIESVIRNSADLFSYRQNLFTILLYAQSITLGGTTGAEQRAVAVVWRDPEYENPTNQLNKALLRFFKWL